MSNRTESLIKQYYQIKDREKAKEFYDEKLLKPSIGHFVAVGVKIKKKYNIKYLISNIGFSPEPTIFFISLFKPKKSFFLCSADTEKNINYIVKNKKLKSSEWQKFIIDPTSTTEIYDRIKEIIIYIKKNDKKIKNNEIGVDLTAGKKAMSAGVAQVSAILNLPTFYVDSDYDVAYRKPKPVTEKPVLLKNPVEYFQEIEFNKGVQFFNNFDFQQAKNIFNKLKLKTNNGRKYGAFEKLSKLYGKWFSFNFDKLPESMGTFVKSNSIEIFSNPQRDILEKNSRVVKLIAKEPLFKIFNFYFAAERYAMRKRYDIAVFLHYRTIEQIFSFLLLKEYEFDVSKPDWKKIGITKEIYNDKLKEFYGKKYYETDLPEKVAFMPAYTILAIKENNIAKRVNFGWLLNFTQLRNNSIFTHGTIPLSKKEYEKSKKLCSSVVKIIFNTYKDEVMSLLDVKRFTFKSFSNYFKFIELKKEII